MTMQNRRLVNNRYKDKNSQFQPAIQFRVRFKAANVDYTDTLRLYAKPLKYRSADYLQIYKNRNRVGLNADQPLFSRRLFCWHFSMIQRILCYSTTSMPGMSRERQRVGSITLAFPWYLTLPIWQLNIFPTQFHQSPQNR